MADNFSVSLGGMQARLEPGNRIGQYVIEQQIGSGGMAVVFSARDESLGRTVALKVLALSLAHDEEFRQRFLRESRTVAMVEESHIVPVYGARGRGPQGLRLAVRDACAARAACLLTYKMNNPLILVMGRIAGVTSAETRERLLSALAHFCLLLAMGSALITPDLHAVTEQEWAALLTRMVADLAPPATTAQAGTAQ